MFIQKVFCFSFFIFHFWPRAKKNFIFSFWNSGWKKSKMILQKKVFVFIFSFFIFSLWKPCDLKRFWRKKLFWPKFFTSKKVFVFVFHFPFFIFGREQKTLSKKLFHRWKKELFPHLLWKKFFLLSAKNEKWKMKNKKLYFEKVFLKSFLLFLGHFE